MEMAPLVWQICLAVPVAARHARKMHDFSNDIAADAALAERILFCDGEALILNKPAGLPVTTPRRGGASVDDWRDPLRLGFQRLPDFVHRLDQDTSGCLMLARHPKALKRFMAAFAARSVSKTYLAIVAGVPDAAAGVIDLPLAKVSSAADGWRMITVPPGQAGAAKKAGAQDARTAWRMVGQISPNRAVLLLEPETGRTHQLRVHLADGLRLPIVGDPQYGDDGAPGDTPMMLHAWTLRVPRDGKPPVKATAPMPDHFIAAGVTDAWLAGHGDGGRDA